jgi:hypothetical protein
MPISGGVCLLRNSETRFKANLLLCLRFHYINIILSAGNYILGKKLTANFTLEQATTEGE